MYVKEYKPVSYCNNPVDKLFQDLVFKMFRERIQRHLFINVLEDPYNNYTT